MDLGAPHGIRFRFESGLLRAVLLDVHGKPPLALGEHLSASGGARDLVVSPGEPVPGDGGVHAVLTLRFDLPEPARWLLTADAPAERAGDGVAFTAPDAVRLSVSATRPCEVVENGVAVELPAGVSEVDITVASAPVYPIADTAVVCRPDQVLEAAVVLSCLPGDRFTPLLTTDDREAGDLAVAMGVRRVVHLTGGPDLVGTERLDLRCDDLSVLTKAARDLLDVDGPTLDVAPDADPATALLLARRTGAVLRVVEGAAPVPAVPDAGTDEAVLVEDTGTTDVLVAALYAHHRGARLVVTPVPDLTVLHDLLAHDHAAYDDAYQRHLVDAVADAVTAQVPAHVVDAVGDRALTAFTTGLPYPFVRTWDSDWARKPVGHVLDRAALVVLTEFHAAAGPRPAATFAVVVDADCEPAADPGTAHHFTHPLVLTPDEATPEALRWLTTALPVELVHLGPDADEPGPLGHRPLVITRAARPWAGTGRRRLRAGARGAVVALWPVSDDLADAFARVVVDRLTAGEQPAARAVVGTGTPGDVERAHVCVGTVDTRLDPWRDRSTTADEAAAAHGGLLAAALPDCPDGLVPVLRRELTVVRVAAEAGDVTGSVAYVDLLLAESAHSDDVPALIARLDAVLPDLDLPDDALDRRLARRHELLGAYYESRGDDVAAADEYERCTARGGGPHVLVRAARTLARSGESDRARHAAARARAEGDRATVLEATEVLGGLSERADDHDEWLRYTSEGRELAAEDGDRAALARFTFDRCRALHRGGDLDAAIATGVEAAELFRELRDEHAELGVLRVLGLCHQDRGDLDTAGYYASAALAQAERLGAHVDVAELHGDLGRLSTARGEHPQALEHYRHAVEKTVAHGAWEPAARLLPDLAVGAVRAADTHALWTTALCGGLICETAERDVWQSLVPLVVDSLKRAIETGPVELTQRGMTDFAGAVTTGERADMPVQVGMLADVVVVLLAWLMDRVDDHILGFAHELDRDTGGVLDLVGYVSVPYRQRLRG
ncbi:hypothetical protein GCM10022243_59740 [Saccharothrix violaceirubra]|uniref:Tetratricopeptide (TPR) repeat protein n=1 Tax=Saccharothrix violaceirubra TaxID=413306 RepID=A0A7W7WVF8_9PSEU|nr:tetratricopeptide repeat protein [Saccharothrix violaceirubra]MBB4965011.1 tetratricopeptide (TPR) repeat protein [Saccharothrix violaceirubra]